MAPEMVKFEKFSLKTDSWSLGCVIFRCLGLRSPVVPTKEMDRKSYEDLGDHLYKNPILIPATISIEGQRFLGQLLAVDVKQRPTASEALKMPFLSPAKTPKSLPISCLVWKPEVAELQATGRSLWIMTNVDDPIPNATEAKVLVEKALRSKGHRDLAVNVVNVIRKRGQRRSAVFSTDAPLGMSGTSIGNCERNPSLQIRPYLSAEPSSVGPAVKKARMEPTAQAERKSKETVETVNCADCRKDILNFRMFHCKTCHPADFTKKICGNCSVTKHIRHKIKEHAPYVAKKTAQQQAATQFVAITAKESLEESQRQKKVAFEKINAHFRTLLEQRLLPLYVC